MGSFNNSFAIYGELSNQTLTTITISLELRKSYFSGYIAASLAICHLREIKDIDNYRVQQAHQRNDQPRLLLEGSGARIRFLGNDCEALVVLLVDLMTYLLRH